METVYSWRMMLGEYPKKIGCIYTKDLQFMNRWQHQTSGFPEIFRTKVTPTCVDLSHPFQRAARIHVLDVCKHGWTCVITITVCLFHLAHFAGVLGDRDF